MDPSIDVHDELKTRRLVVVDRSGRERIVMDAGFEDESAGITARMHPASRPSASA